MMRVSSLTNKMHYYVEFDLRIRQMPLLLWAPQFYDLLSLWFYLYNLQYPNIHDTGLN